MSGYLYICLLLLLKLLMTTILCCFNFWELKIGNLENTRNRTLHGVLRVQSCFRGHQARRHASERIRGVLALQSCMLSKPRPYAFYCIYCCSIFLSYSCLLYGLVALHILQSFVLRMQDKVIHLCRRNIGQPLLCRKI